MNLRWLGRRVEELLGRSASRPVLRVITPEPVVALTFDDGPDPVHTPRLLEILARHGARATFFLIGERASRHPSVVAGIAAAGHAIGNHTWDHPDLTLVPARACRDQIERCAAAIGPVAAPLFRPPYGRLPRASRRVVADLGYTAIKWDVSSEDWQGHDATRIATAIESKIAPGSIVLGHDGLYDPARPEFADRGPTLRAVDQILERAGGRYRFVTIPALLATGQPRRQGDEFRGAC